MRILVFNVAASESGALTVLESYYERALQDKKNEYLFILSVVKLKSNKNIKVLNYPWIKKTRIMRLVFDYFWAPLLVKKYKADEIISLQNTRIPFTNTPQKILIHNVIPFTDHKFSFFRDFNLWVYKNIIGIFIRKSLKNNTIIVQTEWFKEHLVKNHNMNPKMILIESPKLDKIFHQDYSHIDTQKKKVIFLYPATPLSYKNHEIILKACLELKKNNIFNYEFLFTIDGSENNLARKLKKSSRLENLPIQFMGQLPKLELLEKYLTSVLVFPSVLETVGMPLIEAKELGTHIIVSDTTYSREILKDYTKTEYFKSDNSSHLYDIFKKIIKSEVVK